MAPDPRSDEWVRVAHTRAGAIDALRIAPSVQLQGEPPPACIVLVDLGTDDAVVAWAVARALAAAPVEQGFVTFVTALDAAPPGQEPPARDVADRTALARLDGLLAHLAGDRGLDLGRTVVLGLGRGGTLAFLFACHSAGVRGVASLGGPLVYSGLGPERPVQPLELALNLGAPCLFVNAEEDPATPAPDRERVRAVLSQFARPFDMVTLPGREVWYLPETRLALEAFLREVFDDR